MTFRVFSALITACLCALIAWWFAVLCCNPAGITAIAIGSFVALLATGIPAFAIKWSHERSGMMCRLLAYVFFFLVIIYNLIFAFISSWSIPVYGITLGIIVCIYALWIRWVYSTKM